MCAERMSNSFRHSIATVECSTHFPPVGVPRYMHLEELIRVLARKPSAAELAKAAREEAIRSGFVCPCGKDRVQLHDGRWICLEHGDGSLFRKGLATGNTSKALLEEEPILVSVALDSVSLALGQLEEEDAVRVAEALGAGTVKLISLSLAQAGMGESGFMALATALPFRPTLTSLDLTGNNLGEAVSDFATAALGAGSSITTLSLHSTRLGAAGVRTLSKVLSVNQCLTHLDLSCNGIGVEGMEALSTALADPWGALTSYNTKQRRSSTELDQPNQQPSRRPSVIDLTPKDRRARASHASAEEQEPPAGARPCINGTLTHLELGSNDLGEACAEIARVLRFNAHLTAIDLFSNQIDHKGVKELCDAIVVNQELRSLDLQDNPLGERGAKTLAAMLRNNVRLECLVVTGREIGEAGATLISHALREDNHTLTRLDLSSHPVGKWALPVGIKKEGKFGELVARAFAAMLVTNRGLRHLNFEGNAIGDVGVRALIDVLPQNGQLLTMALHDNELSARMVADVTAALATHRREKRKGVSDAAIERAGKATILGEDADTMM